MKKEVYGEKNEFFKLINCIQICIIVVYYRNLKQIVKIGWG